MTGSVLSRDGNERVSAAQARAIARLLEGGDQAAVATAARARAHV